MNTYKFFIPLALILKRILSKHLLSTHGSAAVRLSNNFFFLATIFVDLFNENDPIACKKHLQYRSLHSLKLTKHFEMTSRKDECFEEVP